MTMTEFSKFSKDPELEPHHQMHFNVIPQDNNSIGIIDGTLTGTSTSGQREPESNNKLQDRL